MTRMTMNGFSKFISNYADTRTCDSGSVRHILGLQPDVMNGSEPGPRWAPAPGTVRAQ